MLESPKEINKKLKKTYGLSLNGKPLFRLVRAGSETEKRIGVWEIFYGKVFVRTERGVKECPKYNYINPDFYVLERFFEYASNPEIVQFDGGLYEPVYVFQTAEYKYLMPTWKVIRFIIDTLVSGQVSPQYSESDAALEEQKEIAEFEQILNSESRTFLGHQLANGEAVTVPHNYEDSIQL